MAEQTTNPDAGVADVSSNVVARMGRFLEQYDQDNSAPTAERPAAGPAPEQPKRTARATPEAAAPEAAAPESQAEVLTEADLPEETAAPTEQTQPWAELEIIHNGQAHKIASREEAIQLAQKGFDYTQKTQALAEAARQAEQRLTRAQEIEQVQQAVSNELGAVHALGQQLAQYQNVNWMELAQDPQTYARAQAQYNAIKQAYEQASGMLTAKVDALAQARQQMTAQSLQQEAARLPEFIPEWRDPQRYEAGRQEIAQYLQAKGADMRNVGRYLDSALAVAMVYKAMQYDKLVQSKASKAKQLQTLPPVTKPGAAAAPGAESADRQRALSNRLQKSGDLVTAAALLASRWK